MLKISVLVILMLSSFVSSAQNLTVDNGDEINTRFLTPPGYQREPYSTNSFGTYLRELKLKEIGAPVLLYDGRKKSKSAHISVIDISYCLKI